MDVNKENLDTFLESIGIQLFPYQKLFIEEIVKRDESYIICIPRHRGTDFNMLIKILAIVLESEVL